MNASVRRLRSTLIATIVAVGLALLGGSFTAAYGADGPPRTPISSKAAVLTAPTPTISGSAQVGKTLTAVAGTWKPAPVSLTYRWMRAGVAIAGATKSTYLLVAADAGKAITVRVTGTKSGYTTVSKTSAAKTATGTLVAPTPTISGTAQVGSTLTAVPGSWGPAPVALSYQWLRTGVAISGATKSTYLLTAADTGKAISVRVTGTKSGYTTAAKSSAAKTPVAILTSPTPTISGSGVVGSTLTAVPGTWGPAPVALTYQWLRGGVAISGATASTYKVTTADPGMALAVRVTGTKSGFSTVSKTSAVKTATGLLTSTTPTISGTTQVGSTLTAVPGTWGPAPVTLTYQWLRDGAAIPGATAPTYQLDADDETRAISVRVTGSKSGYTTTAKTSVSTGPITPVGTIRVSRDIATNVTWGSDGTTLYIVDEYVSVLAGKTLTIQPGVVVKVDSGLAIAGSLVIEGTSESGVIFTSTRDDTVAGDSNSDDDQTEPTAGDWSGLSLNNGGSIASAYTDFRYAYSAVSTSSSGANKVDISHATILDSASTGLAVFVDRSGANAGSAIVKIQNTTVERSGGPGIDVSATGVPVGSGTQIPVPTVQNNTVSDSSSYAIRVEGTMLDGALLRGNTGTGNGINTVDLRGTLTTNISIPLGGLPVSVAAYQHWAQSSYLRIAAGTTMTIAAGEVVKADASSLIVDGTLALNGTSASPVVFTSLRDDTAGGDSNGDEDQTVAASGDWTGIVVEDGGALVSTYTEFRFTFTAVATSGNGANTVDISHGVVSDSSNTGLAVSVDRSGANAGTAVVKIQDTTVERAGGLGIDVSATGEPVGSGTQVPIPTVQNNTVNDSTGIAVRVQGRKLDGALVRGNAGSGNGINTIDLRGTLSSNLSVPLGELPLSIGVNPSYWWETKNLTVAPGKTMTVAAGEVVKAVNSRLIVAGTLTLNGTSTSPVVFTSLYDDSAGGDTNGDQDQTMPDSGNWAGVTVDDGGSITSTYTDFRYSTTAVTTSGSGANKIDISSATVSDSSATGIAVSVDRSGANAGTAIVKIQDTTVERSGGVGIDVSATGEPVGSGTQVPIPTVRNNTVNDSTGIAVRIEGRKLDGSLIRDNAGTGNGVNTIDLRGTLSSNLSVPLGGLPLSIALNPLWWATPSLTVPSGTSMTVAAGEVIKASYSALNVHGTLTVNGTSASHAVFTSILDDSAGGDTNNDQDQTAPAAGNWSGITVGDGGTVSSEYTEFRYSTSAIATSGAGANKVDVSHATVSDSSGTGIAVAVDRSGANAGTAIVKIQNSTISRSGGLGIDVLATGQPVGSGTVTPVPTVQNNTVNDSAGIAIRIDARALDGTLVRGNSGSGNGTDTIDLAGTLTTSLALPLGGLSVSIALNPIWWASHSLTVPTGTSMTVAAGQVIKASNSMLIVGGALTVNGTSASPVVFTSVHDDTAGGDTNNNQDQTEAAVGNWDGVLVQDGGSFTASYADIRYADTALSVSPGTHVALDGVTLRDSTMCLYIGGSVTGYFHGAVANCETAVQSDGLTPFDATNVDWGDPNGPAPFGEGATVLGYVNVVPWVGFVAPPVVITPAYTPTTPNCVAYLVLAVRGSGEVPMGPTEVATMPSLYDHFSYSQMTSVPYEYRGLGDRIQAILTGQTRQGFVQNPQPGTIEDHGEGLLDALGSIEGFDVNATIRIEPIRYPAASVDLITTDISPAHFGEYLGSMSWGMDWLIDEIEEQVEACPNQKLTLVGYSQGSLVIQMALAHMLTNGSTQQRDAINAVLLLANPLQDPVDGYPVYGSMSQGYGLNNKGLIRRLIDFPATASFVRWLADNDGVNDMTFAMDQPYPSEFVGRTITYCNYGDMLCAPQVGISQEEMGEIHGGYLADELAEFGRHAVGYFSTPE